MSGGVFVLGGERHDVGSHECGCGNSCECVVCGGPKHYQPCYGGYIELLDELVTIYESWGPNGEHRIMAPAGAVGCKCSESTLHPDCPTHGWREYSPADIERLKSEARAEAIEDARRQGVAQAEQMAAWAESHRKKDGMVAEEFARASRLSDECVALRTENTALLAENARLRREVERLGRRGKR